MSLSQSANGSVGVIITSQYILTEYIRNTCYIHPYYIKYLDFAFTLMTYSLSDISNSELAPCPTSCLPPHSLSNETSSPEEDLEPVEDNGTDNIPNVRRGFKRWSRSAGAGGGCSASRDVRAFRHCKRYCTNQRGST